jgi:succinate dehydrogenase flavin-adding protein (antitoxin of CptAB toxin-antitoxin module)
MIIKKIDEFENLNEGFLSSLFSGVKDLFTSKKSKLESILKDIKSVRDDEVTNAISIEKEIEAIPKDNTPEYRFTVTNLRRQTRTYSALKGNEINALFKQSRGIIEDDPRLEAFFSSEVAKIEVETKEKLLKNIGGGSDSIYLKQINDEFEKLVSDADKKKSYYEEVKNIPLHSYSIKVPENINDDVLMFLNMPTKEASSFSRSLDGKDLNTYYTQVRDFFFDMEDKYSTSIDEIKRGKKAAEKQGNDQALSDWEKKEMNIKYHLRKNIEKLRSKVNVLEKEMKNRRYAKTNI